MNEWKVLIYKDVKKKDLPKLKQTNLLDQYEEIIGILKKNPFENVRRFEKLNPRNKHIYSMRINGTHRVVYTVDKENKVVKIWSAWTHYENNRNI